RAVDDLNLNLHRNQIMALLGHNGAGKTTTVSILATSLLPTGGEVTIFDRTLPTADSDPTDTNHLLKKLQSETSICPQFNIFLDWLTGYEHLELFMEVRGIIIGSPSSDSKEQVLRHRDYLRGLLDKVKLLEKADRLVSTYSGGMKRRLSVAFALMGDPKLVLLDEPTTGMDVYSRKYTWEFIQAAKQH
ncbi:P-loop containing nucleoside triphosphate hydrolase protein, partial [Dimargaris cristalligena]